MELKFLNLMFLNFMILIKLNNMNEFIIYWHLN